MIRSMTGYGRAREVISDKDITVEIKSVNHRYLETFVRISRSYMQVEDLLRKYIQQQISRGKVDISVNIDRTPDSNPKDITVNEAVLSEYVRILREEAAKFSLTDDLSATTVLKLPEVLQKEKTEEEIEILWENVKTVVSAALDGFFAQRETEGEFLASDLLSKCDEIENHVSFISARSDRLNDEYKAKLRAKIEDILGDKNVDEHRLLTEVAIMADKTAIDEELVRLSSHITNFKKLINDAKKSEKAVSIGKKADFIIQEMNRETNTISSKIGDMEVTEKVIEIKNCIEKIREQIQNIE